MINISKKQSLSPQSILVVEDHSGLREELRSWLKEEFPGSDIYGARSGEEAWEILQEREVSLVLMDINLPGENGIEVTRKIKSSMPEVGVIVLTILQDKHYQEDAHEAGADGFVLKRKMNSKLVDEIQRVAASLDDREAA